MTDEERLVLSEQVAALTNLYEQDKARTLHWTEVDDLLLDIRDNIQALIVLDRHERKVQ